MVRTVRAVKGALTCARRCLHAFEKCVPRTEHVHYLTMDCASERGGCGRSASLELELSQDWIRSNEARSPPDFPGKCNCGLRCFLHDIDFENLRTEAGESVREQAVSKVLSPLNNVSVFISHAGEQKEEVAYPLRDSAPGLTAKRLRRGEFATIDGNCKTTAEYGTAKLQGSGVCFVARFCAKEMAAMGTAGDIEAEV